jgi:hypothetical protein
MEPTVEARLHALERRLRRTQGALALCALCAVALITTGMGKGAGPVQEEVRTRRLALVDDRGVERLVLGQDPADGQRRSRGAGLTVHDSTGAERGGFSTLDDGSVVLALDAPVGVGSPMRDRLGMAVWADGSSYLMLLDNETRAVAKLIADASSGTGGVQLFQWTDSTHQVHIKTLTYAGEEQSTFATGN